MGAIAIAMMGSSDDLGFVVAVFAWILASICLAWLINKTGENKIKNE